MRNTSYFASKMLEFVSTVDAPLFTIGSAVWAEIRYNVLSNLTQKSTTHCKNIPQMRSNRKNINNRTYNL